MSENTTNQDAKMCIKQEGVDHQLVKPKKTVMQGLPRVNKYSKLEILVFSPRNLKRKYAILFLTIYSMKF